MSLINRQNQNLNLPYVIETPSSIYIMGQEHDPATLTPIFGRNFMPFASSRNANGTIFTKYSGTLQGPESYRDRAYDRQAMGLENLNRGMKDLPLYRWSDGFNYYVMEYGGFRQWRLNPSNQNLTYALVSKNDATTDRNSFRADETWVIDEDSTSVILMNASLRTDYWRRSSLFIKFTKSTNVTVGSADGLIQDNYAFYCYIGRSSTRTFAYSNSDTYQRRSVLYMLNKSTFTSTNVYQFNHSGSETTIPSETFPIANSSSSLVFYHTALFPSGVPVGASTARHGIRRVIFNVNGGFASGSATATAYGTPCTIDYSASGSLTPSALWPNSWSTTEYADLRRRTKLFLNTQSSSKFLINFSCTPYGYEDSDKQYYNAHVFEISNTNSANLTYRSRVNTYTELGGEAREIISLGVNNDRFLVVTTNNMGIYTFTPSTKTLALTQTIAGEFRSYGVDSYGRLWGSTYNWDLYCFTLDSPVRVNITSQSSSYTYNGSTINSQVYAEARNYLGNRVSVPVRLTIEGNSALFTSNGLSYRDINTSTSGSLTVPIQIVNGGFTRIVASTNF